MCLYIITELTGAALHVAQDERFQHITFPFRVHAAQGALHTQFKKHSHPCPLFFLKAKS